MCLNLFAFPYLERITSIGLAVYHLHYILVDQLSCLISISPVVGCTHPILPNEKVLGVVDVFVGARLNTVDDTRFQIYQNRSRDVSRIVGLVEEDIFAVTALCRKFLQVTILTDPMFLAQLLPELTSNYIPPRLEIAHKYFVAWELTAVAALAGLNRDNFSAELLVKDNSCRLSNHT